jgi:hypothetical protein
MVHGNQWATSTEISVATRILQSNIPIWLQGRDGNESSLLFCCIAMLVEYNWKPFCSL